MKGYTTVSLVVAELGQDLTAPQLDQCADLIGEAESWIDQATGRVWLATSPTTEFHSVLGPVVYLRNRPVVAVTSVTRRPLSPGATVTTLVANTQYELIDAANGILLLSGYPYNDVVINTETTSSYGYLVTVTYTSTTPVPADIQRAATLLVADWMQPRRTPDRQGLDGYTVGDDLTVKFSKPGSANGVRGAPAEVMRILEAHETVVFA